VRVLKEIVTQSLLMVSKRRSWLANHTGVSLPITTERSLNESCDLPISEAAVRQVQPCAGSHAILPLRFNVLFYDKSSLQVSCIIAKIYIRY